MNEATRAESIGTCSHCGTKILSTHPYTWCIECGEGLPQPLKDKLSNEYCSQKNCDLTLENTLLETPLSESYERAARTSCWWGIFLITQLIVGYALLAFISQDTALRIGIAGGAFPLLAWFFGSAIAGCGLLLRAAYYSAKASSLRVRVTREEAARLRNAADGKVP
jgi:hypothetical protein